MFVDDNTGGACDAGMPPVKPDSQEFMEYTELELELCFILRWKIEENR